MKFSEKLQALRKENKMSQEQLADMLDVSRQAVSKWESGTTYPEMDKLITMCKIFKCSLDDLTNDEIDKINIDDNKQKSKLENFKLDILAFIKKVIVFFKCMTFKEFLKFLLEMALFCVILAIVYLPFNLINEAASDIFINFGESFYGVMSSFINFIIILCYIVVSLFLFVYFFKIRYLDDLTITDNVKIVEEALENNNKNNKTNNIIVVEKKKQDGKTLFDWFFKLVLFFVKGLFFFISLPFLISLVISCAVLLIAIFLLFKGVFYLGIFIGIIAFIVLNIVILQMIYYFIFNINTNLKRVILIFICAIALGGIAIGITMIDLKNTKFIDDFLRKEDVVSKIEEFDMNNKITIYNPYVVEYVYDDSMKDKIKIEVEYYKNLYDDVNIRKSKDNNIFIDYDRSNYLYLKEQFDLIVEGLKKKEVYNYGKFTDINVKVYGSKENIKIIQNNYYWY